MMVKTEAKIENITENWTLTKKRGTTDQRRWKPRWSLISRIDVTHEKVNAKLEASEGNPKARIETDQEQVEVSL
jgi:hypothetical protein